MKRILIIDDDDDTRELMGLIFNEAGYDAIESIHIMLPEAVSRINPDLIFVDWYLPEGPGTDFCIAVKSDSRTKDIPVILVSAADNVRQAAVDCHADGVIQKPWDVDDLERIARIFIRQ